MSAIQVVHIIVHSAHLSRYHDWCVQPTTWVMLNAKKTGNTAELTVLLFTNRFLI